jgi:hypothetical protein
VSTTESRSTVGLHFFYVALILGLTIVLLVTFKWTSLAGFTEYLSVAATVTSLVLGILAIIYGFVSSGSINQSLGSVETASLRMSQVAADFQTIAGNSQSLQERAEERTEKLHELIGDMQVGLAALSKTTEKISGSVDALSDRISNAQKASPKEPDVLEASGAGLSDATSNEDPYARFARRASPMGLLALYACLVAQRSGKYVDLLKLVGAQNYEYTWGFLVATNSSGVASLEYPSKKRGVRAVRLKSPGAALVQALETAWASAPSAKKAARREIVERFGSLIEGALVDGASEDE